MSALRLRVITPTRELGLDEVLHLRFEAGDGARGVMFGHERATERLRAGAIHVQTRAGVGQREQFVATEGGIAVIGPQEVVLVSSWAERADDMSVLAELVRARETQRETIDRAARALGQQTETALRRALVRLKRKVSW
ncbi:hypothetical protein DB30_03982 [Enhygromyxa salina]|uniref:ATP synthase epsilon chain n=1 Tax=Enhygromyxa salina TaxID=215803 RepID=A0A0C2D549_9BACT|nr:hypothetical protein [Enhygromyxa salina]KIG16820.1 hypothetical protein DB30_03982 [Enhygromyxa salina]